MVPTATSRRLLWLGVLVTLLIGVSALRPVAWADSPPGDAAGSKTGTANDALDAGGNSFLVPEPTDKTAKDYPEKLKAYQEFQAQLAREPLARKLADMDGQNRVAINLVWVLITGFLVFFMQAGFALLETGFCRAKNAVHVMFMNVFIYPVGVMGFLLLGFGLMFGALNVPTLGGTTALAGNELTFHLFGKSWGLIATKGFGLGGSFYDTGVFALFLFQVVFMDAACTIPTGAMAERWRTGAFVVFGLVMSMFIYPFFGNWAWGGGWLSQLGSNLGMGNGYVDFAGSGVVHAVGGLAALAGAIVIGPRIGKYNKDGSANAIPGHHIPMAMLGTLILAFGWFGFNPGSTLAASGGGSLRISIVAIATMLASCSGAIAAAAYWKLRYGTPDPSMMCNGLLAGLVAITAPSAFVSPVGALAIGAIAGVLVCVVVKLVDSVHVDDPVGAIAVHGANGLWGVISVGLFADGSWGAGWNGVAGRSVTGLLYGGGAGQLAAQLIGAVTLVAWAFGVSYAYFRLHNAISPIRVSADAELAGLDVPEFDTEAYPAFQPAATGIHSLPHLPSEGPALRAGLAPGEVTP